MKIEAVAMMAAAVLAVAGAMWFCSAVAAIRIAAAAVAVGAGMFAAFLWRV